MSITYACHHLDAPRAPLPPSYPSSSSSQHPLRNLYFCEECDAIRCDLCVAVEVASYFCPNCLFDVPSANVRGDRNRCARSCFACPRCTSALQVQAAEPDGEPSATGPFLLGCTHCRWSSRSIGWEFEKSSGLASQLQRMHKQPETVQAEFDALKDHLDGYISHAPLSAPAPPKSRNHPTRHVSHLTQMAAKALHREIPGIAASSARSRPRDGAVPVKERVEWDELGEYTPKETYRAWGLEHGDGADEVAEVQEAGPSGPAVIEQRWNKSWLAPLSSSALLPERIKLLTKLTKRCPHPSCRHLLISPDTKTTRMKIKMVAANYLPLIEIGRRRRRVVEAGLSAEEAERQRRQRRKTGIPGQELDEPTDDPLLAGQQYSFQLAFTNPLYDPIQIRLTSPHARSGAPAPNHSVHIPTPHFTINALKDAWAYDEEDEGADMPDLEGPAVTSESGATTVGTLGAKRSRMSLLSTPAGSLRDKKRDTGVEKKGNITKVGLEVALLPNATGDVQFDLEVRYTYRDENAGEAEGEKKSSERSKEEFKTFTFWIRVNLGPVE